MFSCESLPKVGDGAAVGSFELQLGPNCIRQTPIKKYLHRGYLDALLSSALVISVIQVNFGRGMPILASLPVKFGWGFETIHRKAPLS